MVNACVSKWMTFSDSVSWTSDLFTVQSYSHVPSYPLILRAPNKYEGCHYKGADGNKVILDFGDIFATKALVTPAIHGYGMNDCVWWIWRSGRDSISYSGPPTGLST